MARNFGMIRAHLDVILSAVIGTLEDDSASQDVHIFAAKSLDVIGHFMNIYLLDDKPTADDMRSCQHFWQVATQQLLGKIAQPTEHSTCLLAICCDALSNISAPLFERLPVFEQRYLICTLTDAARSAERAIRAAAVRALGVYVLFPTLRDDRHFVASTVEAIVAAQPSIHLDVRIKTSWALANVAQALLLLVEEADAEQAMAMPVDDEHLKQLFETALLCRLNDMVRSNALRALGSLLRLLRPTHMQHTFWLDMSRTAIGRLHDSTGGVGNTKVKWNACYALGNFMNNAVFFETPELVAGSGKAPSWRALVLPTLCKLIVDFPNFKVRINAAAALAVPARREWLAEHFGAVWSSLLEGLEQSDRIDDFNEYQHRDNLVDQVWALRTHNTVGCLRIDILCCSSSCASRWPTTYAWPMRTICLRWPPNCGATTTQWRPNGSAFAIAFCRRGPAHWLRLPRNCACTRRWQCNGRTSGAPLRCCANVSFRWYGDEMQRTVCPAQL